VSTWLVMPQRQALHSFAAPQAAVRELMSICTSTIYLEVVFSKQQLSEKKEAEL